MIKLADLVEPALQRLLKAGCAVSEAGPGAWLIQCGDVRYHLETRDHTGPVLTTEMKGWLEKIKFGDHYILVCMGKFHSTALVEVLKSGLMNRVGLLEIGLASFYEEQAHPRSFGETQSPVFAAMSEVLQESNLALESIKDHYHRGKVVTYCRHCGHLLAKDSMIPCPLCKAHCCHPDVAECFFKHDCKPGERAL